MKYEIGYRRPPASGQFKKGASGNPKGRTKGSRNMVTLLEQELAKPVVVNENGRRKTMPRIQALLKRLVNDAMGGDMKAITMAVEILRRANRLEPEVVEDALPENYDAALKAYLQAQMPHPKTSKDSE